MLSDEDNERLVRVGSGTPAGALFRRYWQPACLTSELPEPDGAPVRVRILGEDLVAFRDTSGRVGLVSAFCAHRRAPLFLGRNEECGIRCVYHGWKFDADGNCVDLPSEPATSTMKSKIRIVAYPTMEKAGLVWTYMGPKETMPEPPDYEWMRVPPSHVYVTKVYEHCNYLQGLEGGLDTSHSSYLHNLKLGDRNELRQRDKAPRLDVEVTDYGYRYVSTRDAGEDGQYVRVYQFVMPFQQMRGGVLGIYRRHNHIPQINGHIWVPIDDERTHVYNWGYTVDPSHPYAEGFVEEFEIGSGRGRDNYIPGSFVLKRNPSNDWLIDRRMQKTINFTGIEGINTQDFAVQEGMGPIVDRSQEHLGTSDKAIIAVRKLLLEATHAVERGAAPRGADPATHRAVRPYDGLVARGGDWRAALADGLACKW